MVSLIKQAIPILPIAFFSHNILERDETMTTDEERQQISTDRDHVAMIRHPDMWPHWPILPIIHRDRDLLGVIFDVDGFRSTVLLVMLGLIGDMSLKDLLLIPDIKRIKYPSIEDMIADGWEVD